jgi:hypothetical protein
MSREIRRFPSGSKKHSGTGDALDPSMDPRRASIVAAVAAAACACGPERRSVERVPLWRHTVAVVDVLPEGQDALAQPDTDATTAGDEDALAEAAPDEERTAEIAEEDPLEGVRIELHVPAEVADELAAELGTEPVAGADDEAEPEPEPALGLEEEPAPEAPAAEIPALPPALVPDPATQQRMAELASEIAALDAQIQALDQRAAHMQAAAELDMWTSVVVQQIQMVELVLFMQRAALLQAQRQGGVSFPGQLQGQVRGQTQGQNPARGQVPGPEAFPPGGQQGQGQNPGQGQVPGPEPFPPESPAP